MPASSTGETRQADKHKALILTLERSRRLFSSVGDSRNSISLLACAVRLCKPSSTHQLEMMPSNLDSILIS